MALRFVRDNIKQFGGNPSKVTIGGQSAGGAAVGIQTLMPSSKGEWFLCVFLICVREK